MARSGEPYHRLEPGDEKRSKVVKCDMLRSSTRVVHIFVITFTRGGVPLHVTVVHLVMVTLALCAHVDRPSPTSTTIASSTNPSALTVSMGVSTRLTL